MQAAHRDQVDVVTEDAGQLVGELLDLPAELAARAQGVQDVDIAAVPAAVPRARDPKIFSSAIPYLSQTAATAVSSTSRSGVICMIQGYP
jgi:hypothetical protein